MLRKILTVLLILLVLAVGFAAYQVGVAVRSTRNVARPLGDLVRQLAVPATPVVLPDPVVVVREINKLSNLETASYSLQQVVTAQRNQELLWGALGESLVFVGVGEVTAGIDLGQLSEADLQILDPNTVVIHLPPAQVLHSSLDNEQSYVADRDKGLLASVDPNLETVVRQEAEKRITEAALAAGILEEADKNAQESMEQFLNKLGFANVIFSDEPPPPAPPYQQEIPKGYYLSTPAAP